MRTDRRTAVSLLVLVTVAFCTAPGRILPDTKLDMALAPGRFLARALHMWDPSASFGQVQNQAYGYFFPMGPFYWLFDALHVTPWITQRLWFSLVLCTAFLGVVRLSGALRIGTPWARLLAGFAYALAPRAQELLGSNSSEFWPTAVLPWVLLPLVACRSPRRAAALSALAVACFGGVNAITELAVLAVPLVYLLVRRRRLLAWWLPLTAAATFWWLAPTALMGRYIFPFLPYTETATTTTSVTSLTNVLRGTPQWNGYLPGGFSPWWPAGFALSTTAWLVAVTALVAGLGLAGLRRSPHRDWLVTAVLLGLAIIVTGHDGSLFSGTFRSLLDGPLAPFRNLHKFDPLLRLPIVLGLAHLRPRPLRWRGRVLDGRVPVIAAVVLAAFPVLSPGLGVPNAPREIPKYVRSVTSWLDARPEGTVLAVPGQQFGRYLYGDSMDDPLQTLFQGRWAGRMVTPGGSAGTARLMEAIDQRFATGRGTAGLKIVLERMGVRYLLVRNDIDRAALDGAWPARVHTALDGMGLERIAAFGDPVGFPFADASASVDQRYDPVEIYELAPAPAAAVTAAEPLRVDGGPEALLDLADAGLLTGPVIFNSGTPGIATDTLRRREVAFSDLRGGGSPTMTAGEPYTGTARVKDFTEPGWRPSVAVLSGIASVTASSSSSDLDAVPSAGARAHHPYAALDGDPATSWTSGGWKGAAGEWLKVAFDAPVDPGTVTAAFERSDLLGPAVREVAVETAAGRSVQPVRRTAGAQTLKVPPGRTTWLRIEITRTVRASVPGTRVAISSLTVPGVAPTRSIALPATARDQLFTGLTGAAPPCVRGPEAWVCSPVLGVGSEEGDAFDRSFDAPAGKVALTGSAIMTSPEMIARLTGAAGISASSTSAAHPADAARAAFDGDHTTTWIPGADDEHPTLTRDLGRTVTLSRLGLRFGSPQRDPVHVVISNGRDSRDVYADGSTITFAPLKARHLKLSFPENTQVSEVSGLPGLPRSAALPTRCGSGPAFTLDGRRIETRLTGGTVQDVLAGRPLPYAGCTDVSRGPGHHRFTLERGSFLVASAALTGPRAAAVPSTAATTPTWTSAERSVVVDAPAASYLGVTENFNKGWTATLDGRRLTPVKLDGWKQAWELPAGSHGTVRLVYGPDRPYRLALLGGAALVLLVVLLAALPPRRPAPPLPAAVPRAWWLPAAGLLVALWTAGPFGLVAALAALAWARRLPSWAVTVLVSLAGCSTALAPVLAAHGVTWPYDALTGWVPAVLNTAMLTVLCASGRLEDLGDGPGEVTEGRDGQARVPEFALE
ncbi:alpha-(1-_3)-arabinofuranosyltransferase domain-containing protein [Actinocorallia longicatena]|uniref:Alpha-(1->3)-arabinofuranosyltransferase n=1 Tax=Actinocorallia longicatena TaxID=111803 RepID=A0ABP6QI05_9ACTN